MSYLPIVYYTLLQVGKVQACIIPFVLWKFLSSVQSKNGHQKLIVLYSHSSAVSVLSWAPKAPKLEPSSGNTIFRPPGSSLYGPEVTKITCKTYPVYELPCKCVLCAGSLLEQKWFGDSAQLSWSIVLMWKSLENKWQFEPSGMMGIDFVVPRPNLVAAKPRNLRYDEVFMRSCTSD